MPPKRPKGGKPWEAFPVFTEVIVRWRDLDPYQHVNNSVYLNYFEEARVIYFSKLSNYKNFSRKDGTLTTTLVRASLEYRSQAFLSQKLVSAVRIAAIRRSFIDTEYSIFDKKNGTIIATGTATQIVVDREKFKPRRPPIEFIQEIEKFEGRNLTVVSGSI
ncbi:MAG: acyl-CoA thioesterase [Leptospiraceae bacterium]|nr:acyl-CoA thioesterase [Leptospiraceae bacterium]MCB1199912.1 acyl-CoA thioesterase [Leptospiraceae bacterium]